MASEQGASTGDGLVHPPLQLPLAVQTSDYLPVLDGVRAISILIVVVAHGGMARLVPGGLGVTIFFVVSGFLITKQLIAETDRTGSIKLGNFYIRRVLRLAPALLVFLAVSVPILVHLGLNAPPRDVLSAIFYVANYNFIYNATPGRSPVIMLWSLSVEEHYYLVFPLVVMLFARRLRKLLLPICGAIIFASLWRLYLTASCSPYESVSYSLCGLPWPLGAPENQRIYLGTDTRFDSILAGALLAFIAVFYPDFNRRVVRHPISFWASGFILLMTLLVRSEVFRDSLRYTLQELAVAVMLARLVSGAPEVIVRLLSLRPAVYIGRLSYSLYLWHWAVFAAISAIGGVVRPFRPEFLIYLVVSFLLAATSFHCIEQPITRLRRRFGSHVRTTVA